MDLNSNGLKGQNNHIFINQPFIFFSLQIRILIKNTLIFLIKLIFSFKIYKKKIIKILKSIHVKKMSYFSSSNIRKIKFTHFNVILSILIK